MAEGWSYANLSRKAKECGGPEKYIETIKNYSFQEGAKVRMSKQCSIALAGVVSGIMLCQIPKAIKYFKDKKNEKIDEAVKEAEEKLIACIKESEQEEIERVVDNKEQGSIE